LKVGIPNFKYILMMTYPENCQLIRITYNQEVHIDRNVFLESTDNNLELLRKKDIEEEKEMDEKINQFINHQEKKEKNQIYKYTIGKEQIRYERLNNQPYILFSEEFIIINREERIMNHHFISKKKGPSLNKFPFDKSTFRHINVQYKLDTIKTDKKNILGYECYKMKIDETIEDKEHGTEISTYELYVTDEIDFPFHLMNSILKPMVNKCALEFKMTDHNKGESFSIMKAIKIEKNINNNHIKLPKRFKEK